MKCHFSFPVIQTAAVEQWYSSK